MDGRKTCTHARSQHTYAGAPGLLALQYVVDRLTPFTLAAALEQSLKETLRDMRISQVRQVGSDTIQKGCTDYTTPGRHDPSVRFL
jgi:hypothetical protein